MKKYDSFYELKSDIYKIDASPWGFMRGDKSSNRATVDARNIKLGKIDAIQIRRLPYDSAEDINFLFYDQHGYCYAEMYHSFMSEIANSRNLPVVLVLNDERFTLIPGMDMDTWKKQIHKKLRRAVGETARSEDNGSIDMRKYIEKITEKYTGADDDFLNLYGVSWRSSNSKKKKEKNFLQTHNKFEIAKKENWSDFKYNFKYDDIVNSAKFVDLYLKPQMTEEQKTRLCKQALLACYSGWAKTTPLKAMKTVGFNTESIEQIKELVRKYGKRSSLFGKLVNQFVGERI